MGDRDQKCAIQRRASGAESGFAGSGREAQAECRRLLYELDTGTYTEAVKDTLADFLDRWLDDVRTRVTPKTHERYAQIARKNVVPLLGAIPIVKLKPEQISAAYASALTNGRRSGEGGLSPTDRQGHAHADQERFIAGEGLEADSP